MRAALFLALAPAHLLLAACTVAPVEITIENAGDSARFISAYDEPEVFVEEQTATGWRGLASSVALLCIEQCGQPGMIVCADVAPPDGAWVLLPGDSTTVTFEGEQWIRRDNGLTACADRTALTGNARFTVCHGTGAETFDGGALDAPAESGRVGGEPDFVQLIDSVCDTFEFDLAGGRAVTLPIEAP